jgi:prephenate dehydrogenase
MDVLVVGAGEMGTWFGRTLAAERDDVSVAVTDLDSDAADRAADALGARSVPATTDERFDLACFAVPIPAVESAVESWAAHADRALVDVTGVMEPALTAMAAAAPDRERVSFHPLFAPTRAPGNVAVVADVPGPTTDGVRAALADAGNDLFETSAADHDEAMETVQARAHAAVLAFGLAAEDVSEEFHTPVSEALFDLVERVAHNEPRVYADIQETFRGAEDVAGAAGRLADADAEGFADLYRSVGDRDWTTGATEREDCTDSR